MLYTITQFDFQVLICRRQKSAEFRIDFGVIFVQIRATFCGLPDCN